MKHLSIVLAFILALCLLVACGEKGISGEPADSSSGTSGDPDTPQSDGGTVSAEELTPDNWQPVIQAIYGFELTVPSGWTFQEGGKQASTSYYIQFTTDDDFAAAYDSFVRHTFDLTAAINPETNNHTGDYESGYAGEKIEEVPLMMGDILSPIWLFDTPKFIIQIDIMDSEATKTAQIYLVGVKSIP